MPNFIPQFKLTTKYNASIPDHKLNTQMQDFISGYKTSYPGTKLHTRYKTLIPEPKLITQVQYFIPGYKTSYPGTKIHTRYKTLIPEPKLITQVQYFIPGYKTSYPGTKLHARVCQWGTDLRSLQNDSPRTGPNLPLACHWRLAFVPSIASFSSCEVLHHWTVKPSRWVSTSGRRPAKTYGKKKCRGVKFGSETLCTYLQFASG
jgi:hypothetical protein